MRGILVTLANAGMTVWFRLSHIEGKGAPRKRCGRAERPALASVDGSVLLAQTAANQSNNSMTTSAASGPQPAFIEVGKGSAARAIAVRARAGSAPGLFWLSGFNSDMRGTKALALDAWAAEQN